MEYCISAFVEKSRLKLCQNYVADSIFYINKTLFDRGGGLCKEMSFSDIIAIAEGKKQAPEELKPGDAKKKICDKLRS